MNEKDKKSLIIISSVFIFILVFMVFFTFYRRDAMLSDRTIPKINTVIPEIDPPSLGDSCATTKYMCNGEEVSADTVCCPSGYFSSGDDCIKETGTEYYCVNGTAVVNGNQCCQSGYTFTDGTCYNSSTGYDRPPSSASVRTIYDHAAPIEKTTSCATCNSGSYLIAAGICNSCQEPYPNSNGTGGIGSCYTEVPAGYQFISGVKSSCPEGTYASSNRRAFYQSDVRCSSCSGTVTGNGTGCESSTAPTITNVGTCSNGMQLEAYTSCTVPTGKKCTRTGTSSYASSGGTVSTTSGSSISVTCVDNVITCAAGTYLPGQSTTCSPCPEGYYCSGGTWNMGDGSQNGINRCPSAYPNSNEGTSSSDYCRRSVTAGYGFDGTNETKCAVGYYSTGASILYNGSTYECTKCQNGYTTESEGSTKASDCISDSPIASVTSSYSGVLNLNPEEYGTESYGYYTVQYTAKDSNGNRIDGTKVSWSVSNSSVIASQGANTSGYTITYKGLGCDHGNISVTVTGSYNGGSATSSSVTVHSDFTKWSESSFNQENTAGYPLLANAHTTSSCRAVSEPYQEDGVTKYRLIHNRCCGGGGGGGNPPATSYCYRKLGNGTENQYQMATSSPGDGWAVYNGDCNESPACYLRKSDNAYVTGIFKDQSGYTYYGTSCPAKKCYVNRSSSENKYQEAYTNPGTGWEEYDGTCSEDEACYLRVSDNVYVVGKYKDRTGYTAAESPKCNTAKCYINKTEHGNEYIKAATNPGDGWEEYDGTCSEDEACYLRKSDNTYVTGKYSNRSDYQVTELDNCSIVPDVPKTDMNTHVLVYIITAIMSVLGIYFVVRYNNKSKNI